MSIVEDHNLTLIGYRLIASLCSCVFIFKLHVNWSFQTWVPKAKEPV